MEIRGRRFLVVGLGVSGIAAAGFLARRGAAVTATDANPAAGQTPAAGELAALGVRLACGELKPALFDNLDAVVLSPGVPHYLPAIARAAEAGVEVMGEIELAARFIRAPIVAVTGTNGKTTTTELLGAMLKASGVETFVGGNIGAPLIGYAEGEQVADVVVAELSSFQLDTISRFRPSVAALLNITPDHLDRYPDMEAYARSKGRIFENQTEKDVAVINGLDPLAMKVAEGVRSRKRLFMAAPPEAGAAGIRENRLWVRGGAAGSIIGARAEAGAHDAAAGAPKPVSPSDNAVYEFDLSAVALKGRHNMENIAAAAVAALAAGATPAGIRSALADFRPGDHRLTHVATIDGVRFYDDSKGTNADAVKRAIESFNSPVLLIMGGRGKRGGYDLLRDAVRRRVRLLLAMGEAADEILAALGPLAPSRRVADMAEAVRAAFAEAAPGDVALLSPGCSSFDRYVSYAARGDDFRREVRLLEKGGGRT